MSEPTEHIVRLRFLLATAPSSVVDAADREAIAWAIDEIARLRDDATAYTQAEEVVYWHGFDDGGSRAGIMGSRCRYHDRGLVEAYESGFANGRADTTGGPFPCRTPGGSEELREPAS